MDDRRNSEAAAKFPQVTRKPYRDNGITLPLLGFGLMRLPTENDGGIDDETGARMVELAMKSGCNYFDTAYMYHGGDSERFVGRVLSQYPRESYFLTSKMPIVMMKSSDDNKRIFEEQLERTRAGYFDFYFLHWLNAEHWEMAKRFGTIEFLEKMREEGKIRKIGFSFHGEPEELEPIAAAYPWELVQIQLNYVDWELCRAGEQYEILTRRGIPVSVMEPLKGGALARLSPEAEKVLKQADPEADAASWGLRFAASLPNVQIILSGMSAPKHVEDNLRTFSPFRPLTDAEKLVIAETLAAYRKSAAVPCSACRYCAPCPAGVDIPRNLALLSQLRAGTTRFNTKLVYDAMRENERASSCIGCGACLKKCPQQIRIPDFMKQIAQEFK